MKKNWAFRLAGLAIVMTLVTSSLVAGTYAKYTQAVTGAATVRVAKFAFNLKDGTGTFTQAQSGEAAFDIFSYTDSGVYDDGSDGTFIAPGTTGSLALEVENLSEVDVTATFALTETNAGSVPLYYTLGADTQRYSAVLTGGYDGGGTYQGLAALQSALATAAGTLQASDGTTPTEITLTLNWIWAFETAGTGQSDALDTALGVNATPPTVKLAIATTVTQKD